MSFHAIYLEQPGDGSTSGQVRTLEDEALPPAADGTVTVDVACSTINYKDALALTGRGPVIRRFPMIPGIDLAGTVIESRSPLWQTGDLVVATGSGLGEDYFGGLSERARVPAEWLVRKPGRMTLFDTMAIGTAGFTAALCMLALAEHGVKPGEGDVLVTGATGGVGSIAVMLLAESGHTVVASTGKMQEAEYLRELGAHDVIDRSVLAAPGKPLQRERWTAAIDTVGSHTLANVCASTRVSGIVAACGLAQGMDFPATVAPFILRGITLAGINSVFVSKERRRQAWSLLDRLIDLDKLRGLSRVVTLGEAPDIAPRLLAGELKGRVVVDTHAWKLPLPLTGKGGEGSGSELA